MLAVISSPRGFEITLAGAATLSQAHLIQRGLGTGGRTPGTSLLSRVLTATHVASCRTKIVDAKVEDGTERQKSPSPFQSLGFDRGALLAAVLIMSELHKNVTVAV